MPRPPNQTLFYPISEENDGGKVSFTALLILLPFIAILAVMFGGLFLLWPISILVCKIFRIPIQSEQSILKESNVQNN